MRRANGNKETPKRGARRDRGCDDATFDRSEADVAKEIGMSTSKEFVACYKRTKGLTCMA